VDGSGPAERVLDWDNGVWAHTWSPDGQWLVFRDLASNPESRDIYTLRVAGDSAAVPLLNTRFNETAPAISPDGRWLAYVSNESGREEVYVRPFPNVGDGNWQVSRNGGGEPKWAHSGRELFYREGTRMMVAEVVAGATFDVSAQRVLFDAGPLIRRSDRYAYGYPVYDVSPDDQRFLMARLSGPSHEAAAGLILVENFLEELKVRVGR
jgi:dipeptidyl aminopeptidase/acylaminoacyl peptidase